MGHRWKDLMDLLNQRLELQWINGWVRHNNLLEPLSWIELLESPQWLDWASLVLSQQDGGEREYIRIRDLVKEILRKYNHLYKWEKDGDDYFMNIHRNYHDSQEGQLSSEEYEATDDYVMYNRRDKQLRVELQDMFEDLNIMMELAMKRWFSIPTEQVEDSFLQDIQDMEDQQQWYRQISENMDYMGI